MNIYTHRIADWKPSVLQREIDSGDFPELLGLTQNIETKDVQVQFAEPLTPTQEDVLEQLCLNHDPEPLWYVKELVLSAINGEAGFRITGPWGLEWPAGSGNRFSLTLTSQSKWTGLYNGRNVITYPYAVRTKDDGAEYQIADAAEVEAIYNAIVAKVSGILAEATAAKKACEEAGTVSDAWAVKNNYFATQPAKP